MDKSKSVIYGSGYLNRVKLKHNEAGYIYGNISIRTSRNNIVSFNVFQNEFTRNGNPNPCYKCMLTVMNKYKDVTSGDTDYVEIKMNDKYPNASLHFRDNVQKSLKFITRVVPKKSRIVFKVYGVKIIDFRDNYIKTLFLGYDNTIKEIEFFYDGDGKFSINDTIDVTGLFKEGLYNGLPTNQMVVKNIRLSELNVDFDNGIIKEINNDDPF